ncbi:MAG: extracellular solute-binding protein [Clostridiales bacterium]|nr:extracellular solute-binding protein [Clostridiales bacterium]
MKRGLLFILIFVIACSALGADAVTQKTVDEYEKIVSTYSIDKSIPTYESYKAAHTGPRPENEIVIQAASPVRYAEDGSDEAQIFTDFGGSEGLSLLTGEEALAEWEFDVEEPGWYDLEIEYYPYPGKNSEIQRAFFLDGLLPYRELSLISFSRIWRNDANPGVTRLTDENGVSEIAWVKDNQGNDLRPSPQEDPRWLTTFVYDSNGYISESLSFYLESGRHTLGMLSLREPMLVKRLSFKNDARIASYSELRRGEGCAEGICVRIEGETAQYTSSQMLYPVQDQASSAVYPASARYLLNNTIGGYPWRLAGQWIEWTFQVPEEGDYCLTFFDKQNFVRGVDVYRKIYVDGKVPFSEFDALPFSYSSGWRMETAQDENEVPYLIHLTGGTHTLRMEVVLGRMAEIISRVQQCVLDLNGIYRQVLYITGVSPDQYRDYQIERSLPGLKQELEHVKSELEIAISDLERTAGHSSDKLTVLKTMNDQLTSLIKDQERFTKVLSSFKTNVRACGNWITQVLIQPLQIDRIYVHTPDVSPKTEGGGFFAGLGHESQRLYNSFIIDYNQVGNVAADDGETKVITLWIGTGRDQANVIKALIDDSFTPQTGISVNVQLVDMNTLLRATLSGQGPDVAIQVANTNGLAGAVMNTGNDTPVNYGLRHAVMDLTAFDDFGEVADRFMPSALVPFSFNGATYALPDTQTFPMLFYRKDILAEIGLEVPETWDDVKVAMSVLSKNQMEFGMLPGEQTFAMLLYQAGGSYYTENGDASALDSDTAINTFRRYCEFYTDYRLDKATSVEERFRTGECPIIIADYTTYNNLQVSAPDIRGLWDFTHVPGTVREDGSIDTTTGCSGLADIIMSATKEPEASWEFLKWWTSAQTQTLYGREMESLMGSSARVATANMEALANLSWPVRDYKVLSEQFKQVRGIPQVPGGYYTWRNVNNAFYAVTTDNASKGRNESGNTPREELMDKIYYINAEINYKRTEFGLPLAGEGKED